MNDKLLTLLGFAKKANHVVSGEEGVLSFVKKNAVRLLIIAKDAPDKKKKNWIELAQSKQIDYIESCDKESLGLAIGNSPRAVVGILEENMAKALKNTER